MIFCRLGFGHVEKALIRAQPSRMATRMSSDARVQAHYEAHSSETYESAFFYEPGAYTDYLSALVKARLGLDREPLQRTLIDIGGGTGNFTEMIVQGTQAKAVVVDPFLVDESSERNNDQLQFVRAPAESFKDPSDHWWRRGYEQVLLKEVIHHIDDNDRVSVFRGIHNGLVDVSDLPSLLIITRPHKEIDYPLWPEAKRIWEENQPSFETLRQELMDAGFTQVEQSIEAYPCSIPLKRWQHMIKQRFWSTFSAFSDAELEAACTLIAETENGRVDSHGHLHFDDRLLFLTARKMTS